MKKAILFFMFIAVSAPVFADGTERYVYNTEDKVLVDTLNGVLRRFVVVDDKIHFVETNYITGTVKVDGVLKATGFDFHSIDKDLVLIKTDK